MKEIDVDGSGEIEFDELLGIRFVKMGGEEHRMKAETSWIFLKRSIGRLGPFFWEGLAFLVGLFVSCVKKLGLVGTEISHSR